MIEKIPMDSLRRIHSVLTTGNDDIYFYCMCLQNQNREAATNNPVKFAIQLVKVNILCRIPFVRKKMNSKTLGHDFLSLSFVRPTVCSFSSSLIDNSRIITDVSELVFETVVSREKVFEQIEKDYNAGGFARLRKKYDNQNEKIEDIYNKINSKLEAKLDYQVELDYMEKNYMLNKYAVRLLDIADCNSIKVYAMIRTSYPREAVEDLLNKYGVHFDELLISSEHNEDRYREILSEKSTVCVLSSDYHFIKKMMKYGAAPMYYRSPKALMKRTNHPKLREDFTSFYEGVCGVRLFSGSNKYSNIYELAYLCVAPGVVSLCQNIMDKSSKYQKVVCLCNEYSIFGEILHKIYPDCKNISFVPWSKNPSHNDLIEDTKKSVLETTDNASKILIIDPLGATNISEKLFVSVQHSIPTANLSILSASEYLGCTDEEIKIYARILQGNSTLLCKVDTKGEQCVSHKKIPRAKLVEVYEAIIDFQTDLSDYFDRSGSFFVIDKKDSSKLYKCANEKLDSILD